MLYSFLLRIDTLVEKPKARPEGFADAAYDAESMR